MMTILRCNDGRSYLPFNEVILLMLAISIREISPTSALLFQVVLCESASDAVLLVAFLGGPSVTRYHSNIGLWL